MGDTEKNNEEINSVYNAMKEMYIDYCEILDKEKRKLEILMNQIKETKEYIQYLDAHQNSDTYMFSPRGVISKNNGSIQEGKYDAGKTIDFSDSTKKQNELAALEDERVTIENRINKLQSDISVLERNNRFLKNSIDRTEEKKSVELFSHTIHMIEMINTFIDNDPVRAKLELTNIKNVLQSIAKDIDKTIGVPEGEKK